ncbi:MAG TPA: tetratricopeptide repeat protein [Tepidisphaeraceae bacterium]|jgi:tetratricopeptide (TPR) repeat protein
MISATGDNSFDQARRHHEAGRLREAELGYRQILAREPDHPRAIHMLGLLAAQSGHPAPAAELLRRAAALDPDSAECHNHLGLVLLTLGEFDEAIAELRKVIALAPDFPDAHNSLGAALKRQGHVDDAIASYRAALNLRPGFPEAANNLGAALQEKLFLKEAVEAYQTALASRPQYAEALSNLGNAFRALRRLKESEAALQQAASVRPDSPEIHYNLGITLHEDRRPQEALVAYKKALALRPDYPEALNNLGNVLHELMDFEAAIMVYQRAVTLQPNLADAFNNLGRALKEVGRLDEAISAYRTAVSLRLNFADAHSNLGNALVQAGEVDAALAEYGRALQSDESAAASDKDIELQPHLYDAQWNCALAMLLQGDFERGWSLYEVRNRAKAGAVDPAFLESFWDGSELAGQRILLLGEQGLGDTIHFIRYAPMVAGRGGRMVLVCQSKLASLLRGQLGLEEIVSIGEPLPQFDVCCPLMSLPHIFKTRQDTIPHDVPYLSAEPIRVQQWKQRLKAIPAAMRVGLVWAGNPTFGNDRHRSIALEAFALLAKVDGVRFFSLQKGEASRQAQLASHGIDLIDWSEELLDFSDTAALISNLDLVIAVDTAVAHLAGALAKNTWTLIPFAPDWRWRLNRTHSDWYPTMRLFRQPKRGDWATPLNELARCLPEAARLHARRTIH